MCMSEAKFVDEVSSSMLKRRIIGTRHRIIDKSARIANDFYFFSSHSHFRFLRNAMQLPEAKQKSTAINRISLFNGF